LFVKKLKMNLDYKMFLREYVYHDDEMMKVIKDSEVLKQ